MKRNTVTLPVVLLAVLALVAFTVAAGYPIVSPEALVGLGAIPMVGGNTEIYTQLRDSIEKQTNGIEQFKSRYDARLGSLEKDVRAIDAKGNRPGVFASGAGGLTEEQEEQKAAFSKYLRKGDRAMSDAEIKALNTGNDDQGGYLVIPEVDRTIDRVAPTISAMYRVSNVVTIGTNKYEKRVKTSGMTMRRVAEGATGGETTEPRWANIAIEVHPAEVEPWVNNETLEDSFIDLENDLAGEAGVAFAQGAGAEFISGDGVGKARGILTYTKVANASFAWGKTGYVVSGAAGAFKTTSASVNPADALIDAVHALKAQYRTGASWLMNSTTASVVRKLKDNDARYCWTDSLINGQPSMLLGYPVEIDDNMPDIAANEYAVAFGNFKRAYTIVNRTGTTLIRDNVTSKGVTKFNFRRRFGGGITQFEAIKLLKFATS